MTVSTPPTVWIVRVGVPQHTREGVGPRRPGGGDRVGDGGIPLQREADLLVVHPHSRRVVGAGYVDEPCGQRLRHPPDAPVVGEKDGDRHRPARGHRRLVEGPGGAGSLHRDGVYAADRVVGPVGVPEHTREGVGPRRPGGGDRVGDGGIPLQREADLLAVHPHSRRVVGAGYVGEPCGQRLRHPSNAPVVGNLDGDRHRPAGGHRCRVEAPGGAGFILLRGYRGDAHKKQHTHHRNSYHYFFVQARPLNCAVARGSAALGLRNPGYPSLISLPGRDL